MTVVTLRSSDGFLCENKIKADELAKKKSPWQSNIDLIISHIFIYFLLATNVDSFLGIFCQTVLPNNHGGHLRAKYSLLSAGSILSTRSCLTSVTCFSSLVSLETFDVK